MSFLQLLTGEKEKNKPLPLSTKERARLYQNFPALIDYLPFVNYNNREKLFTFYDNQSCGVVWRITPIDMEARKEEIINQFCATITDLLKDLPKDDQNPFICQIYLQDEIPENIADRLERAIPDYIKERPYTQRFLKIQRDHFNIMRNPIFADSRTNGRKGWKAVQRSIYITLYRMRSKSVAPHRKYNSYQIFNRDIQTFEQKMQTANLLPERLDHNELRNWLLPWFTPNPAGMPKDENIRDWLARNQLGDMFKFGENWDLAETIMEEPPLPLEKEYADQGIFKFGNIYSRFITLRGVEKVPEVGCLTVDKINADTIAASLWDEMPDASIKVLTIIPQTHHTQENKLTMTETLSKESNSRQSLSAQLQSDYALQRLNEGSDEVFFYQAGIYLFASSLDALDEKYYQVLGLVDTKGPQRAIKQEHDLIPGDSYVRNLPMVFSFNHDRKNAKRSMMTFTSHIAAISPFYGRAKGSKNPCFTAYNRAGEVITINPFHPMDRAKAAHQLLFGPTGSGKSATANSFIAASQAVNAPRQFVIDKGGSFAPLFDLYEKYGLKVRRIIFKPDQDISFPPYAESIKALAQMNAMSNQDELPSDDDDDARDYISEVVIATQLMITGGEETEIAKMTRPMQGFLRKALKLAFTNSLQKGEPHARPQDVYDALLTLSKEAQNSGDDHDAKSIKDMANAMSIWLDGIHGKFFNNFGHSFNDSVDATLIELGVLTDPANTDMLFVAFMSIMSNLTALGERTQNTQRSIEFWVDEAHYVTTHDLMCGGIVQAVKVWRKLGMWMTLITQNTEDFPTGSNAGKLKDLIEFWWLLQMSPNEAREIASMKQLTDEQLNLVLNCKKEPGNFVECVLLSGLFPAMLMRQIQPSLILELAKTEAHEKTEQVRLMNERGISRIEAIEILAEELNQKRSAYKHG